MYGLGNIDHQRLQRRVRACDYLVVAQLFLQDNFLLERRLRAEDVKSRLLGHWGTCPGINVVYASIREALGEKFEFILGPGHGFPALQANLFVDGVLGRYDKNAKRNAKGIEYICREFSWPGGYPSHASPFTPRVICEGGELGYALGAAYGSALGHPEKTVVVLIGDGEFETATALASMNLGKLFAESSANGLVVPILHLNGYKISAPTVAARKSERELAELIRGFGYEPRFADEGNLAETILGIHAEKESAREPALIVFRSEKGATGPSFLNGRKVAGNYLAHQIPLPNAKSDEKDLRILEAWLKSYRFEELFDKQKGFTI